MLRRSVFYRLGDIVFRIGNNNNAIIGTVASLVPFGELVKVGTVRGDDLGFGEINALGTGAVKIKSECCKSPTEGEENASA